MPVVAPARESKSNGAMKVRVKVWQSQFRTLLLDLQQCIGSRIPLGNNVISWLVNWAATSTNKFKLDKAGRTAFYRVTGSSHRRPIAKCCERVWWIPNGPRDAGMKAESRTQEGTYLGIRNQTSESLIAIEDGITSARTVRRMPADRRWNKDAALDVKFSVAANGNLGVEPAETRDISSGGDMVVNSDAHEKSDVLHKMDTIYNLSMTQFHQVNQLVWKVKRF